VEGQLQSCVIAMQNVRYDLLRPQVAAWTPSWEI